MSNNEYNRALSSLGPDTGNRVQMNRLLGLDGLDRSRHASGDQVRGRDNNPVATMSKGGKARYDCNNKSVSLKGAAKVPTGKRSGASSGPVKSELTAMSKKLGKSKRTPRHMREHHGFGDMISGAAHSVYDNVINPAWNNVVKPVAQQAINYAPELLSAIGSMKGGAGGAKLGNALGNIGRTVAMNHMDPQQGGYAAGGDVHQPYAMGGMMMPQQMMKNPGMGGGQFDPRMMQPQVMQDPQMLQLMQAKQQAQMQQQGMDPSQGQANHQMYRRPMFSKGGRVASSKGTRKGAR